MKLTIRVFTIPLYVPIRHRRGFCYFLSSIENLTILSFYSKKERNTHKLQRFEFRLVFIISHRFKPFHATETPNFDNRRPRSRRSRRTNELGYVPKLIYQPTKRLVYLSKILCRT